MDAPEDRGGALARYREGPALLEAAVTGLTDDVLDFTPAAAGWTIREIVHHVADGDDLWKLGIKMALGANEPEFALAWYWEASQRTWGERWAYRSRPLQPSLALLKAIRAHVLQLVEPEPEAWDRAVLVRDREGRVERVPVGFMIGLQADHLLHHLQRTRKILEERNGD